MARLTERQKSSRRASRSKAQKKRLRSLKRYTLVTVLLLAATVAAAGSWWLVDSGWMDEKIAEARQSLHRTLADAGFGVRNIYVQGRGKTGKEQVTAAIGLKIGESLFSVPLADIKTRLETLKTVRSATVERSLPGTLRVTLRERVPVAVWQNHGRLKPVDGDGVALDEDAGKYPHLMVVVGEGAPGDIPELTALLATQPELAAQVAAAVRVGDRRWNIRFKNGVEAMLPDTAPEKAWSKLAEMQSRQGILAKSLKAIDLRVEERIFITLPPRDAAAPRKTATGTASEI